VVLDVTKLASSEHLASDTAYQIGTLFANVRTHAESLTANKDVFNILEAVSLPKSTFQESSKNML
jgi:hypothetical protein